MKRLCDRILSLINCKSGETLIEGIASVLVLTVLIIAVTMMLMISMRITANTTATAQENQANAGNVLRGTVVDEDGDPIDPATGVIGLTVGVFAPVNVPVLIHRVVNEGVVIFEAFEPQTTP